MTHSRILILAAGVALLAARAVHAQQPAKKTSTDVETVRSCTDQWRRSMKGSPSP